MIEKLNRRSPVKKLKKQFFMTLSKQAHDYLKTTAKERNMSMAAVVEASIELFSQMKSADN